MSDKSQYDCEVKIKDTEKWYYVRILEPGENSKNSNMIIMLDISNDKLNAKKIEYLNHHDGLTGLFNRNYLEQYFDNNHIQKLVPLSIVMADMNNLKLINDAFGHHKGDELLVEVGRYLQSIFRSKDIICRWGGDEFVIVMPHADYDEVNSIVKKIHEKSFMIGDLKITSKLAAGFNTISNPEHFNFSKEIIIAEDRMYRNKLTDEKSFRSNLIDSLKKALFEKSSETESHAERLKKMSVVLSEELNLPESIKDDLNLLASLHDIGKLGIGETVLSKQGLLKEKEMNIIRKHPETGYNICKTIPELVPIAEYILCHNEWWNGTGYPRG